MDEMDASIWRDVRYLPTFVSLLALGIVLLVYRDLGGLTRQYFVPSLAVYTLGSGIIASAHATASVRAKQVNSRLKNGWVVLVYVAHVIWLGFLIGYGFRRDVF